MERLLEHRQPWRRHRLGHVFRPSRRHAALHLRPRPGPMRLLRQRRRLLQPRALVARKLVQRPSGAAHRPAPHLPHRRLCEQPPQQLPLRRGAVRLMDFPERLEIGKLQCIRLFGNRVRANRRIQRRLRPRLLLHERALLLRRQQLGQQRHDHQVRHQGLGLADAPRLERPRPRQRKGNQPQQRDLQRLPAQSQPLH